MSLFQVIDYITTQNTVHNLNRYCIDKAKIYIYISSQTSKVVSITQFPLEKLILHKDLPVLDEEHAVTRSVLLDDDVTRLEDLIQQLQKNGIDEVYVTVPENGNFSHVVRAQGQQNFLIKPSKSSLNYKDTVLLLITRASLF